MTQQSDYKGPFDLGNIWPTQETKKFTIIDGEGINHLLEFEDAPKENQEFKCSCGKRHPFLYGRFFLRSFKDEKDVLMHEDLDPQTGKLEIYCPSLWYWNPASKPY